MRTAGSMQERLLDAAADILEKEGLSKLNTNALAERAGTTPPTVYRYFRNKEEVVARLAQRFTEREKSWLDDVDSAGFTELSLPEAVDCLIDHYWESARKQSGIVALRGAMRVWPELRAVEEESLRSSTEIASRMLIPLLPTVPSRQRVRIVRHIVETVCSTVDRCYPLDSSEQAWRIVQLKKAVAAYLGDSVTY